MYNAIFYCVIINFYTKQNQQIIFATYKLEYYRNTVYTNQTFLQREQAPTKTKGDGNHNDWKLMCVHSAYQARQRFERDRVHIEILILMYD
jgi:hypothetical protein